MKKNNYWYTSDHDIYDWFIILPNKYSFGENLLCIMKDILAIGKETGMYEIDEAINIDEYLDLYRNSLIDMDNTYLGEVSNSSRNGIGTRVFAYNENQVVKEFLVKNHWEFMKKIRHPLVESENRPIIWSESINITSGFNFNKRIKERYFLINVKSNIFLPKLDLWWVDYSDNLIYDNTELAELNSRILNDFMLKIVNCLEFTGFNLIFESNYNSSLIDCTLK